MFYRIVRQNSRFNFALVKPEKLDLAVPAEPQSIARIAASYPNPWVRASNCAFFEPGKGTPLGRIQAWGRIVSDYPGAWPVLRSQGGKVTIEEGDALGSGVAWTVAGGPVLVRGGKVTDVAAEIARLGLTGLQPAVALPRTGVGIRPDGLVVHAVAVSMTLEAFAQCFAELGCVIALNFDGGGSSTLYQRQAEGAQPDRLLGDDTRPFPCALMVLREEPAPVGALPADAEVAGIGAAASRPAVSAPQPAPSGLRIADMLLTPNAQRPGGNRPGTRLQPSGVTVHRTGDDGATAKAIRDWFDRIRPGAESSAHYVVDFDGTVIRCIPEDEVAWHAGPAANGRDIGIETCEPLTPQAYQATVALVADIHKRYGWTPKLGETIRPHSYYDPTNRPEDPFSWAAYQAGKPDSEALYAPRRCLGDVQAALEAPPPDPRDRELDALRAQFVKLNEEIVRKNAVILELKDRLNRIAALAKGGSP